MTNEDLKAWRTSMGYTQRTAASALGVALKSYQQLESGKTFGTGTPIAIDQRTALACAALAARLPPWNPADG